ncbi:MAG: serine/threonine protein kinase [Planctomycetes bacterium]|nr:serine/threonine protein kinase [Planctomycetota bacterium]
MLAEAELRRLWTRTLPEGACWDTLPPGATYRAADETRAQFRFGDLTRLPTLTCVGPARDGASAPTSASTSAASSAAPPGSGSAPSSVPASVPPHLEFVEEIGRGGMGVVYRARQASLFREVAVKVPHADRRGADALARFVSGALVTGMLDHPNICPVHELARAPDGRLFLVMKLVEGTSWKRLLHPETAAERAAAGEYDLERHVELLLGVGNALGYAHSKGLVHRDVKPDNVMVGRFGEVLVMDWDLAVAMEETSATETRAFHRSSVRAPVGTPSYMPPELVEARWQEIGPWTDVYLLGAILHEVVTGSPPHTGRTLMEVLLAAARSAPPTYGAEVPPPLAAVCRRALAARPEDRYPRVEALQAELRRWLAGRAP